MDYKKVKEGEFIFNHWDIWNMTHSLPRQGSPEYPHYVLSKKPLFCVCLCKGTLSILTKPQIEQDYNDGTREIKEIIDGKPTYETET